MSPETVADGSGGDSSPSARDAASTVHLPVEAVDLTKSFRQADGSELRVLERVEFSVEPGEAVAVIGASGAGKSTLLHLLGGLDHPTSGIVRIGGRALNELHDSELASIRSRKVGFVFQFHHLLREFTALENVMMPPLIAGESRGGAEERARALLGDVGLADRLEHKPRQLSGGEQQRVAVARALVAEPRLLLADEPTGNLDSVNADQVFGLVRELHLKGGLTSIIVTHNEAMARRCDRVFRLAPLGERSAYV